MTSERLLIAQITDLHLGFDQGNPDEFNRRRLDRTLRALAEGLRVVTVLLHPYLPESTAKLLDALGLEPGDERLALVAAAYGAGPAGTAIGELAPLFPKPQ